MNAHIHGHTHTRARSNASSDLTVLFFFCSSFVYGSELIVKLKHSQQFLVRSCHTDIESFCEKLEDSGYCGFLFFGGGGGGGQ